MERDFHLRKAFILPVLAVLCASCVSTDKIENSHGGGTKLDAVSGRIAVDSGMYGGNFAIAQTISAVVRHGDRQRLSSRAVRLPELPLGEITVSSFAFPSACGGHQFRVIETNKTQVLEYTYPDGKGDTYHIRDYVRGANPFIKPGLWTAFDHTADSISLMSSNVGSSQSGPVATVYSRGLVTSLPKEKQHLYGRAYHAATDDVISCPGI